MCEHVEIFCDLYLQNIHHVLIYLCTFQIKDLANIDLTNCYLIYCYITCYTYSTMRVLQMVLAYNYYFPNHQLMLFSNFKYRKFCYTYNFLTEYFEIVKERNENTPY